MAVDKFRNSGDDVANIPPVSASIGLTMSQISNAYLRCDGGNNASGNLDMNDYKVINVANHNDGDWR